MSLWGANTDYGSVPTKDTPSDGKPARSRDQITSMVKKAESGDWTWKFLGAIGGVAMIFTGSVNFGQELEEFNGFAAIFDVYVILFGILTIVLEFKDQVLPKSWIDGLKVDAKFMYKPFGRAVLYCFFGVLLLSQAPILYICTGLYLLAVGSLVIYFATQAQAAIDAFKSKKLPYSELKSHYDKADKNGKGLTIAELAKVVCGFEGNSMSESEMAAGLLILDKKNTGIIHFDDFVKWYGSA